MGMDRGARRDLDDRSDPGDVRTVARHRLLEGDAFLVFDRVFLVDAGDLSLARLLEPYGLIWIHLALRRGIGTNFAFGLLRGEG